MKFKKAFAHKLILHAVFLATQANEFSLQALAQEKSNETQQPSQVYKVTGTVKAKGKRGGVADVKVFSSLQKENVVETDKNGNFSYELKPQDANKPQSLIFRGQGFEETEVRLTEKYELPENGVVSLEPAASNSDVGIIIAKRKTEVSQTSVRRKELERIAGTGGDAVRSLATLPSVISTGGGSANITVRGSAPGDNKYFIDRLEAPFIFHLGGLGTVVPSRVLDSIELYPGGFSSQYNDAIGGVVQLRTESTIPEQLSGRFELGLVQSSIYMEGKISRDNNEEEEPRAENSKIENSGTEEAGGEKLESENKPTKDIGWRAGVRRTYLEIYAPVIEKAFGENGGFTTLPQATDYQILLNGQHTNGSWQMYSIGASNRIGLSVAQKNSDSDDGKVSFSAFTYFSTLGARSNYNLGGGWGLQFAPQYRYLIVDQKFLNNKVKVNSHLFAFDTILDKRINAQWSWSVGARPYVERQSTDVDALVFPPGGPTIFFDPDTAPRSKQKRKDTINAGQANIDVIYKPTKNFTINPGVAFLQGRGTNQTNFDPRFQTRYTIGTNQIHGFKGAWGMYSQSPNPATDSKDYGNPKLKNEQATHYVLGWDTKWSSDYESSIEIYHKDMKNLVATAVKNPEKKYENNVIGKSQGFEVFLKKQKTGKYSGWLSYGFSKSQRKDPKSGKWRLFDYDVPHSVNLLGSYKATGQWELSSKLQYKTGTPYTKINGAQFNQATGKYIPNNIENDGVLEPNNKRIPSTFQVDVRSDYDFLFDNWTLDWYIDISNILNTQNVVAVQNSEDYRQEKLVYGAPIIPTTGIIASF
jgi:TonB-dependent Receptor Plug Domain